MSLEWLIEDTFTKLDRGFLLENQTRKKLEDYFNAVIEEFRLKNDDGDGQTECKMIVHAAIAFHQNSKAGNNGVCLFGKYHDVLYVAANLCYTRNLADTDTVATLLRRIYECEQTFEKFFECAIFGAKVTQLISGWRSYYKTPGDNLKACVYFVRHAAKGRLTFGRDGHCARTFVDVPMSCYENVSPLKTAVKAQKWDVVATLLKCGAITYLPFAHHDHHKYSLFQLYVHQLEKCAATAAAAATDLQPRKGALLQSFRMFVRTVPTIYAVWQPDQAQPDERTAWLLLMRDLQPEEANEPKSLKHLARCAARTHLARNHLLPASVQVLRIPKVLERYINLDID